MPVIPMFYGIIVRLFFHDNKKHNEPHIHAEHQGQVAVIAVNSGELLDGDIPPAKMKLVLAWLEIHKDELLADWKLAVEGQPVFKIDGLNKNHEKNIRDQSFA
jgi:hypothetical protein